MSALEQHILDEGLDPQSAMDALQNQGIVDERAVWASDVNEEDYLRAIQFLQATEIPKR